MSFGLSTSGLNIKRASDIKTELETSFQSTFGKSINLDARSILGQIIGIVSEREALVWELLEEVYNSQYPDTSEGVPLDNVVAITGTNRKSATKSVGVLTLIGDAGTLIPLNSVISVQGNEDARFITDADATIQAGTDEEQLISFLQVPDTGTFILSFNGVPTSALDETATDADVEAALEALDEIDAVSVSGSFSSGFTILFQGDNGLSPQPEIAVDANLLRALEKGTIDTVADVAASLDQTWFRINEVGGSIGFWIDVDDSGSTIPAGAAAMDRAVEITTINTGDSASVVATKVAAALQADAAISSASAIGSQISYVAAVAGALADFSDGDTGFTFNTTVQGRSAGDLTITTSTTTEGVYPQIDVSVTAEEAGEVQAPAGTLTVIETPVSGWDSCTNALDIDVGTEVESDQALKLRRLDEIAIAGKATPEAIRAALIAINEVTAVVVFTNNSSIEDQDERPPHSVDIVVEGGDEDEIAEEVFDVVAAGIETIGDISKTVNDSQGFAQTVKFSRPDGVEIHCEVDLTVDANEFPSDGAEQVRDLIVAHGNSLGIGKDVIVYIQLVCSFSSVPGILDVVVRIGAAAMPVAGSTTVTAADNAGDLEFTKASHGLIDNNRVTFSSTGTLPDGISAGVIYHVVSAGTDTFQVATERGGDPVPFNNAGTGTHTVSYGGRDDNIEISSREVSKWDTSRTTITVL